MEPLHINTNNVINSNTGQEHFKIQEKKPLNVDNLILTNANNVLGINPAAFNVVKNNQTNSSTVISENDSYQAEVSDQQRRRQLSSSQIPVNVLSRPKSTNIIYIRSGLPQEKTNQLQVTPLILSKDVNFFQQPQQSAQFKPYLVKKDTPIKQQPQSAVQIQPHISPNDRPQHPQQFLQVVKSGTALQQLRHVFNAKPCFTQNNTVVSANQQPNQLFQVKQCIVSKETATANQQSHNKSTSTMAAPYVGKTMFAKGQNILEEMKRQIAQNFLKSQTPPQQQEGKSGLVPGTDCEYRTPGAHYMNKNGRIKRPMNAFMVWAREVRGKLAAAMPNATNSDISVKLGQLWANLPAAQKTQYYKTAESIKMKHRQDFPDWVYRPTPSSRRRDSTQQFGEPACQINQPGSPSTETEKAANALTNEKSSHLIGAGESFNSTLTDTQSSQGNHMRVVGTRRNTPTRTVVSSLAREMLTHKISGNISDTIPNHPDTKPFLLQMNNSACTNTDSDLASNHANQPNEVTGSQGCQSEPALTATPSSIKSSFFGQLFDQPENKQVQVPLRRPIDMLKTVPILETQISPASRFAEPIAYKGVPVCTFTPAHEEKHSLANESNSGETPSAPLAEHQGTKQASVGLSKSDNREDSEVADANQSNQTDDASVNILSNIRDVARCSETKGTPNDNGQVSPDNKLERSITLQHSATADKTDHYTIANAIETLNSNYGNQEWEQMISLKVDSKDDLWPFPFPEDSTSECWEDSPKYGPKPMYMELLEPYDPFLSCDYLYSDMYPGCLYLDMGRWHNYLHDDVNEGNTSTDPLLCFTVNDADDTPLIPVPLKETLMCMTGDTQTEVNDNCFCNINNAVASVSAASLKESNIHISEEIKAELGDTVTNTIANSAVNINTDNIVPSNQTVQYMSDEDEELIQITVCSGKTNESNDKPSNIDNTAPLKQMSRQVEATTDRNNPDIFVSGKVKIETDGTLLYKTEQAQIDDGETNALSEAGHTIKDAVNPKNETVTMENVNHIINAILDEVVNQIDIKTVNQKHSNPNSKCINDKRRVILFPILNHSVLNDIEDGQVKETNNVFISNNVSEDTLPSKCPNNDGKLSPRLSTAGSDAYKDEHSNETDSKTKWQFIDQNIDNSIMSNNKNTTVMPKIYVSAGDADKLPIPKKDSRKTKSRVEDLAYQIPNTLNINKVLLMTHDLVVKPRVTRSQADVDTSTSRATCPTEVSSPCKRQRSSTALVESKPTRRRLE